MKTSSALVVGETASSIQSRYTARTGDRSLAQSRLAFYCLVGFVAAQGYLVPLVSLPFNWAVWPSLPDLFGLCLVLSVVLSANRPKIAPFDRDTLKDLLWMGLFFALNFLYVTIPLSTTGEGVKYGGYTLILFAKYLVVYWAAAHVPIDPKRMQVVHVAALMALLWVSGTMLADRLYLIEIDDFTSHLPRIDAGRWSVIGLDSTVSANPGGTTVVILILGALAVGTARHRLAWLVEGGFFVLGMASSFISASRQGLVRMAAFVATYSVVKAVKYFVLVLAFLVVAVILYIQNEPPSIEVSPLFLRALDRQEVLLTDPFSNEGLAGRPELWQSVLDTLNADPIRWVVGYGMGNYAEYQNPAHNMVLQLLQDGGIIELVLVGILWIRIFRRIWMVRREAWALVALTASMLASTIASAIFYPTLSTGWYLGLYFVAMHLMGSPSMSMEVSSENARNNRSFGKN